MSISELPGRTLLMNAPAETIEHIAEKLSFAGIQATTVCEEEGFCALFVSNEQLAEARALLAAEQDGFEQQKREETQQNYLKRSPVLMSSADQKRNRTKTAKFFIIFGILAVATAFRQFETEGSESFALFLLIGLSFLLFGIITSRCSHRQEESEKEEDAFVQKVRSWFLANYSADDIDLMIFAAMPCPDEEELVLLREELIRDYIEREFCGCEEGCLNNLVDLLYRELFGF